MNGLAGDFRPEIEGVSACLALASEALKDSFFQVNGEGRSMAFVIVQWTRPARLPAGSRHGLRIVQQAENVGHRELLSQVAIVDTPAG